LTVDLHGVTKPVLNRLSPTSGEWSFGNRRGIDYTNVETVTPIPVTLSGQVFNDLNGNGVKEPNEPGLPGFLIQLSPNPDGTPTATTATDANGNYRFTNLPPGTYQDVEVQQPQRRLTSPAGGRYQVTVVSGQNVTGRNFGNLDSASKSYVYQVYLDLLGRKVDPLGLANWSSRLDQGWARQQVVAGIQASLEYRQRVVEQTYQQFLRRAADVVGLQTWVAFLGNGGTLRLLQASVLASPEYFARRGGGTNAGFLVALYADVLGRAPVGAAGFAAALQAGVPRIDVATAVLTSLESNTRLVGQLYQQYLRRPADPTGLQTWVGLLSRGGTVEQVIQGIVGSLEYYTRF
jgi:hypothetical protein